MTQISASAPGQNSHRRPPALWAYTWWAAIGALLGFGVVSLLTIGVFLLPVAIALGVAGILWAPLRNQSAISLLGGLAAAPLDLAWLNREGPGTVCETIEDVTECSEQWSPWPIVAVALLLLAVPVVVAVRTRRTT